MTRAIKFRGRTVKGQWVYGDLLHYMSPVEKNEGNIIVIDYKSKADNTFKIVYPDTVGQYTGLKDKNGKDIYEGDIIASERYSQARHYIRYLEDEAMFIAMIIGSPLQEWCAIRQAWIDEFEKKVVGNIHDNPELLKTETL